VYAGNEWVGAGPLVIWSLLAFTLFGCKLTMWQPRKVDTSGRSPRQNYTGFDWHCSTILAAASHLIVLTQQI
jgi:hypothetical protein